MDSRGVQKWTAANQTRSPSPKRWAPRRSRSPSPVGPQEWEPNASPTRSPPFSHSNVGPEDDSLEEQFGSGGRQMPRGAEGTFPFGAPQSNTVAAAPAAAAPINSKQTIPADPRDVPRWTGDQERRSPSPTKWAPRRGRSPGPAGAREWEPTASPARSPTFSRSAEEVDVYGGSRQMPGGAEGGFPFGAPLPVDNVVAAAPTNKQAIPADSRGEAQRWIGNQQRRSPSPTKWAPRRGSSPVPAGHREWELNASPARSPPFSHSVEPEDDSLDESFAGSHLPKGADGNFPFAAPENKIAPASPVDKQAIPAGTRAVAKWSASAGPSRSPSPTRWEPRRSRSPSPAPKGWEPSPSPTRPLFPRTNPNDDDNDGDDGDDSLIFTPKGASGKFPFGYSRSRGTRDPDAPMDLEMARMSRLESIRIRNEAGATDVIQRDDGSVSLTWEDVWITASSGKAGRKVILRGVSGFARPGEVLAIMGPSGCGKSTLLDTLAGRLGSNITQSGDILLNGRRQTLSFGTSAYVTQDDVLMTTMTVREAVYYSAQLQLPGYMSISQKRERAEETIREMGLGGTMDTRIGGWASKGLSGGQRRRVSICTEILTRPPLLFLDEPTSGLDSAASYHVMSRIAGLARREGMTVVTSIHQPSTEVFELFQNLCLLAYGKTVWFGPPSMTSEFFSVNGFPCPSLRNPSDHYLRTINQDFDKDIEEGPEAHPRTTAEVIEVLVNSYKLSNASQQVLQQIGEICKTGGLRVAKGNQASFFTQSFVLVRRSFVNMYRDLGYYWLRFAIYIALCLCVGTIYNDIGHSFGSIQARGSMLSFVAAFLTFMAIGGFPSFVEDMKIFGRERLNGHYGVTAFVIGNTISSIPYLVLISLIPGALAYYLVGLQKGGDHFAYFTLVLFMCMMVVEGLMMIVASIVPDFLMGIITGAGIQGIMMLNGGFFRLPDDLPKPVWRYPMYHIAFHKYANQGFYKNEFQGLTFPNNQVGGGPTISGEDILKNIWQVETGYSKWIDLAVLFGMVILYRILFLVIIKGTEKFKPKMKAMVIKATTKDNHVMQQSPTHSH